MRHPTQVVLITGAASGIGRALCPLLARQGAVLALLDRDLPRLQALVEELTRAGHPVAWAGADVRERDQVRAAVAGLTDRLGPADVLIASAGVSGVSVVSDLMVPQLEEMLQVNFLGVVYAIEAVLPAMLQRGSGHLVGIASLAAFRAIPFESAYCASKAALAIYLESLRPPLRRSGIAVTTVYPGFVRTPLLDGLLAASGAPLPPGVVEVDVAARRIVAAIRRRARVCCFPRATTWLAHAGRWLPAAVYDWVMGRVAARIPLPY